MGETATRSAGVAISDSIGSQTRIRDASLITTDFQIDLGNATAPAKSYTSAGNDNLKATTLGVSSSAEPHDNCFIALLDESYGIVTSVELICVETPQGGEDAIGLWYGTNASGSDTQLNIAATQLIAATDQSAGILDATEVDADIDGKYLYLATTGSTAAAYTHGKFIVRLYGYTLFDDVA